MPMASAGVVCHGDGWSCQCHGNGGNGINLSPQGSVSPHTDSISLIFGESEGRFY